MKKGKHTFQTPYPATMATGAITTKHRLPINTAANQPTPWPYIPDHRQNGRPGAARAYAALLPETLGIRER